MNIAANCWPRWRKATTTSTEVKSADGKVISVINRPMADGGWVATHEDITERRDAEQERALMQEQQRRRGMIEEAIAAFRRRVEDHLRTVTEGRHGDARDRHHAVRQFRRRPRRAPRARSAPPTKPPPMWRPPPSPPTN